MAHTPFSEETMTFEKKREDLRDHFAAHRSKEELIRLVLGSTAITDRELAERIADRIAETGECVWHAASVVCGTKCWCSDCRPDVRRFA